MDIKLVSGKSYKGELKIGLLVFQSVPTNKISFRLGFTPNRWSDKEMWELVRTNRQNLPDNLQHELGKKTYWSNEVSVDLIPN